MIPRGIEVLIKKASIDPAFRKLLLGKRAAAAEEIGLELAESETAMLKVIAVEQLDAIIECTSIAPATRRIFLGKAASVMLAALGAGVTGCGNETHDEELSSPETSDSAQPSTTKPDDYEITNQSPEIIKAGEYHPSYNLVKPGEDPPDHRVEKSPWADPNAKPVEFKPDTRPPPEYRGPPGAVYVGIRASYGIRPNRPPAKER